MYPGLLPEDPVSVSTFMPAPHWPMSDPLFPSPSSPPVTLCDYSEWSPTWVLIPSIYLLAFTLGSLGNGLVLWAYLDNPSHRRACLKPQLQPSHFPPRCSGPSRSLTDSLIASLAVADLAFVLTLPLWAVYTALGYHWPFGLPLCKVSSYLVALNMYASVFSLTGLSVERYCIIAGRLQAQRGQGSNGSRVRWIVGGIWAAAGILALPALILRTVTEVEMVKSPEDWWEQEGANLQQDHVPFHIFSCEMDYSGLISTELTDDRVEQLELWWTAAMGIKSTLLGFLLPLAILLLCYCSLGRLLTRHFRRGPRPDRHQHRRLLRVIVTLVLAFFLCWLPFHANKTLVIFTELGLLPYSCPFDRALVAAHPYTTCLAYINSCLNPLLYACCDQAFRHRCRAVLDWCQGKSRKESVEEADDDREEASRSSAVPSGTQDETQNKM